MQNRTSLVQFQTTKINLELVNCYDSGDKWLYNNLKLSVICQVECQKAKLV